jgi:hypothetical protein
LIQPSGIDYGLATLYADAFSNSHVVWQQDFQFVQYEDLQDFFVTTGDFNGDGADDLALMWWWMQTGLLLYWWMSWLAFDVKNQVQLTKIDGEQCNNIFLSGDPHGIVTGDFDGDLRDEVLVQFGSFVFFWLYDDTLAINEGGTPSPFRLLDYQLNWDNNITSRDSMTGGFIDQCAVGDLDGDQK